MNKKQYSGRACVSAIRTSARCGLLLALMGPLLDTAAVAADNLVTQSPGASATQFQFSIASGSLAQALVVFSRVTGIDVIVDGSLDSQLTSAGLSGTMSADAALDHLLANSGMQWYFSSSNTVQLVRSSAARTRSDAIQLGPVRVQATTISDEVYQTAGSMSVLKRDEIERFRGTSVGDIFKGTTGVLVGENRNSGGLDVNIRGMQGQSRVPVLIDGARQETTVWRGYAGVASRTYVDPDLIGAIEISKGPVMSAEGTGATGGVVSMRTIEANDVIKPGQDWGIRARGSLMGNSSSAPEVGTVSGMNGTNKTYRINCAVASLCAGQYAMPASFGLDEGLNRPDWFDLRSWAGSLVLARRFDNVDVLVAYAERNQGNYYSGSDGPVPELEMVYRVLPFYTEVTALREGVSRFRAEERIANSNMDSNTLLLKSNIYLADDKIWELSYQRYDSTYGELMPSQLIWLSEVKQTRGSEVTAQTFSSRYHWEPADNDWINVSFNQWYTRTDSINRNYSEDLLFAEPEPEQYDRIGVELSNKMTVEYWGLHNLNYGVSAQREDMDTDIGEGDSITAISNTSYGRIGDRSEFSVFFDWQWKPLATLTWQAGLRYSRAKTDDHKQVVPTGRNENLYDDEGNIIDTVWVESVFCVDNDGDGECDPIRYRTNNSGTAPVVSVIYEPWLNGLQFYARHAQAYRMPSLFETTQGWSVQPSLDYPLRPEHASNNEIGINYLANSALFEDDRLALKLAYFNNITEDYLTRTSPNLWEESGQFFVMRNIESVSLDGTELSLEYDAGIAYTKLGGTYYDFIEVCHYGSYRRERCNNYGVANSYFNNMIPPRWHANATLGARLFNQRLDIGVRGTFMGQRTPTPDFNDDTARGFNSPVPWHEYTIWDAYVSWKHNDILSIDFNVDNLTDQYYLDALSLGMVPAPGRTARLSFTVNF